MMLLSLAWSMAALAQDSIPSDSELEERLLATPDAQQVVRASAPPWWLWPMGLCEVQFEIYNRQHADVYRLKDVHRSIIHWMDSEVSPLQHVGAKSKGIKTTVSTSF